MTDPSDPLYKRKYAHTMPPLHAYRLRPAGWEKVNVEKDDNARKVFFGWNNVTEYEKEGIRQVKEWLRTKKDTEAPANFSYRKLLKFCQANFYNIEVAGLKLFNHFKWLDSLPFEPRLSRDTLKLL